MLYKKTIVIWANNWRSLDEASVAAVQAARNDGEIAAYGLGCSRSRVTHPSEDADYDPSVYEMFGDDAQ